MLSLIKIQKLCNLRENHLSLMEMISDKNNNLDKLYYNDFLCKKRRTKMKEPETGKKEKTGKSGYSITTWRLHLWCRHPEWLRTTQEFYNRIAEFYYNLLLDHTDLWEMGSQQTLRELEIMSIPGRGGRIPSDPLPWQKVPLYFRRAAANEGIASAKSYLSRFAQDEKIGRAEKLNAAVTNKRSALLMWILVYVIYEVLDAWFISNKRTYAVRLFKIMFGIAIGIFILSIVKIKGNTILSLVTGKFTGLFSEDSRSYMQRYGALIIALELILQKNSIFGFLFGNGLSSLVGNFVTNRRTITDLNFYVIDNQYITSWYDSGFVFLILCVFICVHFIIELTKIIVDKHIEISLRKKSLVLLIGMILVMFYSFIIDVLTWYQPIFIISFIIALSNWNIKEANDSWYSYK